MQEPVRHPETLSRSPKQPVAGAIFTQAHAGPSAAPHERLYEVGKPVEGNVQNHEAFHGYCLPPQTPTIGEVLSVAEYHAGRER